MKRKGHLHWLTQKNGKLKVVKHIFKIPIFSSGNVLITLKDYGVRLRLILATTSGINHAIMLWFVE